MNRVLEKLSAYYSNGLHSVTYKNEIKKFHSQLEAVARAIHGPRYWEGYNSATTAQMSGPQVVANAAMKRHENATKTAPALGLFIGFTRSKAKCPTKAYTLFHFCQ